jgi:hypothetical protein
MFRSTTIIRELALSLTKVILKHSVKYVVLCYVVVWKHEKRAGKNMSTNNCIAPFHSWALIFSLRREANRFNTPWLLSCTALYMPLLLCAALYMPYDSWTDRDIKWSCYGSSWCITQLRGCSKPKVLNVWFATPSPSCFANVVEGVKKIPSNVVSGRAAELVPFKDTRLTNQFSTCFLFLAEAQVFYGTPRITYSLIYWLLVYCCLQITFSYLQFLFFTKCWSLYTNNFYKIL